MIALRLVLDTNILVSAALKPEGLQRNVLQFAVTKPASLYVTDAILAEYDVVLHRPALKIRKALQLQLLQLIRSRARKVNPRRMLRVADDPDDDKFLECAEAARADYLVTGNLRDFPRYWKGTKIINARDLLEIIAPHLPRR